MDQSTEVKTENGKHLAAIVLGKYELADIMGLPHETNIINTYQDMATGEVWFVVESPDLPLVEEGKQIPVSNPVVTTTFDWGILKK